MPAAGTTLTIDFHAAREAALHAACAALKESVHGALVMQTRLKPYLDQASLNIGDGGIALDYAAMTARLEVPKNRDATNGCNCRQKLESRRWQDSAVVRKNALRMSSSEWRAAA